MATNKHAQIRYLALDKCLSNRGRRYYIADLVAACNEAIYDFSLKDEGVKKRQVYEDIKFMESERGWKARIVKTKDGKQVYYRYEDSHYSINQSPLNHTELTQIKEVIFTLSKFTGMPQFEWVSEISDRLQNLSNNRHNGNNRIIDFEQNKYLKGLEHITTIFNAIHHQYVLKIKYAPFKESNEIYHNFHPYYLKQYNLRWFVFGLATSQNQLTNLALDRIENIEESQISYIPNNNFDFNEYFEDIVGVTLPEGGSIDTVIISVKKEFLPYLQTKPLHGSQASLKSKGQEDLLSFKLIVNYELISKLLSFGDNIKVIEPMHLAKSIQKQIQLMALQYKT